MNVCAPAVLHPVWPEEMGHGQSQVQAFVRHSMDVATGAAAGLLLCRTDAQHIFMHGLHRMAISQSHHPQLRSAHRCASAGSHTLLFGCALWVFNCTGVPVALREVAPNGEAHTVCAAFDFG